jgi:hypothetical protein
LLLLVLLLLEVIEARLGVGVLLTPLLDLLAGVVRNAADHGGPHQRTPSSHPHRRAPSSRFDFPPTLALRGGRRESIVRFG